nr:hypothetical protein [Escherichia coli]
MSERLKTHSKTQKKSADLVSNKLRIGVFQRYQMKCKSVSKKSPRYTLSTEYLTGLGALGDRMLILVNIEKLLNSEEMALLDSAASEVA